MRVYGLVAIILFVGVTVAGAQEVDPVDFEAMKVRLEALEQGNCADCNETCCDPRCRPAGFTFGAELCFMKPYHTSGFRVSLPLLTRRVPFDFKAASRFWLEYTGRSGLGVRARVWDFDHTASAPGSFPSILHVVRVDMSVFDLEVTDVIELSYNWDALVSAGFRHLDYTQDAFRQGGIVNLFHLDHGGFGGLTVSGELRRYVNSNLTLFANTRLSALFGDQRTDVGAGPVHAQEDRCMVEGQLGMQWQRPLAYGSTFLVRGTGEVQYLSTTWNDAGFLKLIGGTLALGIQR